jgi:hypothetical protein
VSEFWEPRAAGGRLTEEQFFATFDAIRRAPRREPVFVTSRETISRGLDAADRLEARAKVLFDELVATGWWRWRRRRRLRREFAAASDTAGALRRTFGPRR